MLRETKKKVYTGVVILLVIVAAAFFYLSFVYMPKCQNYECWQEHMIKCSKTSFVNEQIEASWGYKIKGKTGDLCDVEVTLLLAKEGELGIDKLVGDKMICSFPIGTAAYAENDLSACSGLLKEKLQTLIINKLHAYILENLAKVAEGIEQAV